MTTHEAEERRMSEQSIPEVVEQAIQALEEAIIAEYTDGFRDPDPERRALYAAIRTALANHQALVEQRNRYKTALEFVAGHAFTEKVASVLTGDARMKAFAEQLIVGLEERLAANDLAPDVDDLVPAQEGESGSG